MQISESLQMTLDAMANHRDDQKVNIDAGSLRLAGLEVAGDIPNSRFVEIELGALRKVAGVTAPAPAPVPVDPDLG